MPKKKLKYKDIVKKPFSEPVRKQSFKNKHAPNRKTRQKFGKTNKNFTKHQGSKRRNIEHQEEREDTKRKKIEQPPPESTSESESDDEAGKLLKEVNPEAYLKWKKLSSTAIESEESSEEEDDEIENDSEIKPQASNVKDSCSSSSEDDDLVHNNESHSDHEDNATNKKVDNEVEDTHLEGEEKSEDEIERDVEIEQGEEEEESDDDIEHDVEVEKEEEEDIHISKDPFVKHISFDLHESVLSKLQSPPVIYQKSKDNWPSLGKISIEILDCGNEETILKNEAESLGIDKRTKFASPGTIPVRLSSNVKPREIYIKSQIIDNLISANPALKDDSNNSIFTPLQSELFSVLNNYQDLYFNNRTYFNAEELRFVYCLHTINHILKTRTKVIHHNAKLIKQSKKGNTPPDFQDQGLVRPKVLIVVPFMDSAYRIINMIISLLLTEDKGNVINKSRFLKEYTGNALHMPTKNPKPKDFEMLFTGNITDDFKIGLSITKKCIKLYAPFYSSDIIIGSPLGLRRIIGAEGDPDRDYDFLASIELLILDQAEVFLMQNWSHVTHILQHMHLDLKTFHGTDLSRVRSWSLDGLAKYYRQTLIFSSLDLPLVNAIFYRHCHNYRGRLRTEYPDLPGEICQVKSKLRHCFMRFEADSALESIDARFKFFTSKVLSEYRNDTTNQTLIFVPSYYDYVRIRNYFRKEDVDFVQICEYSKESKIARARDMFFHGESRFLLYTERFHFFHRIKLKGIRHLIFYQPPTFPHFYKEMCNLMQDVYMNKKVGSNLFMTVTVIYSRYDSLQLAAVVGTDNAAEMINSDISVHNLKSPVD